MRQSLLPAAVAYFLRFSKTSFGERDESGAHLWRSFPPAQRDLVSPVPALSLWKFKMYCLAGTNMNQP